MARRTVTAPETEADRYWRDKTEARRHYGAEVAVLAVFLVIMALS